MRFPVDVPTLSDGVVTLRAHRPDDSAAVVEQCNDPLMARWTQVPTPYSVDDAKRFLLDAMPGGWATEVEFGFAIEAEGRFAGTCTLRDLGEHRAEISYGAHPWARGRGFVGRALRLLVDWGLSERFDTLVWQAQQGNWDSRKAAWRLGFTCQPMRGWLPHRGALVDAWVGTLRKEDPREPMHPWYDVPVLRAGDLVLRPHVDADLPRIAETFVDPVANQWLRITKVTPEEYLANRLELMASGGGVYWAVAEADTDELLGAIMLFGIEHGIEAELGYWAHPAARGKGAIRMAAWLACRHGFIPEGDGGLGLRRLTAFAGVDNGPSRGVLLSLGFREYGVDRLGGRNVHGDTFPLVCYDLLAEEFR